MNATAMSTLNGIMVPYFYNAKGAFVVPIYFLMFLPQRRDACFFEFVKDYEFVALKQNSAKIFNAYVLFLKKVNLAQFRESLVSVLLLTMALLLDDNSEHVSHT